jgi:hypothetical protein
VEVFFGFATGRALTDPAWIASQSRMGQPEPVLGHIVSSRASGFATLPGAHSRLQLSAERGFFSRILF